MHCFILAVDFLHFGLLGQVLRRLGAQEIVCMSAFAVRPVFPHNEEQFVLILVRLTWWIFQLLLCGFALVEELFILALGCLCEYLGGRILSF